MKPSSRREHESTINHYRLKRGLTIRELSMVAKVSFDTIASLNNGTRSPLSPRGNGIKPSAQKIADALEVPVALLFPRYFCNLEYKKLTPEQVTEMLYPEHNPTIDWKLIYRKISNKRVFLIIRLNYMGYSMSEIGKKLGITREYVRQLRLSVIRRLKYEKIYAI